MTESNGRQHRIAYRANDIPKWWMAILLGIQVSYCNRCYRIPNDLYLQTLMSGISGILVIPFQVSNFVCAGTATAMVRVQLISTTFVVCGITTILQVLLGLRCALK